jgi:hypothetical protein
MAGPPSRSSFPSVPGEPRVRRLGVGASSSGDRPLRAQIVVALVVVTMLIAVPLYLLRRPGTKSTSPAASASGSVASGPLALPKASAGAGAALNLQRIKLGPVQKVKCGSSANAAPNDGAMCDTLGFFEEALKKAILETDDCAPRQKAGGSINYVLTVDFPNKKLHVYPGASGEWRAKQARRATTCVARAIKVPDWGAIPHQYRFYALAVLATYGPPGAASPPASSPGLPSFE